MKIAIASGKGGTGKTTLAVNLASYLGKQTKIVLTDLDVEEPNSGLFIKGKTIREENKYKKIPRWEPYQCTLCGLCQEVCNYHAVLQLGSQILIFPELCHSCYACSELCPVSALPMIPQKIGELKHYRNNSLNFIESRLEIGQEQAVPLITQTIEYVDKHFNNSTIKLYDSPPGTSCPVIEAVKDADFVILVTEPTPFGLHDLRLAVDVIKALKKKYGVVVNRFGIGNSDVLDFCEKENIPVLAKIPNDRRIAELYSRGLQIYQKMPEMKQQLERIADYLMALMDGGNK